MIRVNGVALGGGGVSLPTDDVGAVLGGVAGGPAIVGVDGSGDGVLVTGPQAQTLLRNATTYDAAATAGWTATAGSGGASVTGGVFRLTMPAGTNSSDPGRASLSRDHTAVVPVDAFRARVRLVAVTNGDSNTFFGLHLWSSANANELRLSVHPNGSVECGCVYAGPTWSGTLGSLGAGAVAFDGTWWLEITVQGLVASLRIGQGTTTSPPSESSSTWRYLFSSSINAYVSGGRHYDRIGLVLTTYGTGGGAVTVDFDDLTLERLA